jgi:hypothetical protein
LRKGQKPLPVGLKINRQPKTDAIINSGAWVVTGAMASMEIQAVRTAMVRDGVKVARSSARPSEPVVTPVVDAPFKRAGWMLVHALGFGLSLLLKRPRFGIPLAVINFAFVLKNFIDLVAGGEKLSHVRPVLR